MSELQVRDLNVWYGAAQALFDVSLTVGAGELVVLQGLNGAGKSTLLQSILGLSQRHTGVIRYQNEDISDWAPHRRARAGLGFVAEDRRLFGGLTVQENLLIAARGDVAGNTARVLALFPALERMLQRRHFLAAPLALPALPLLTGGAHAAPAHAAIEELVEALGQSWELEQLHILADRADRALTLVSGRVAG